MDGCLLACAVLGGRRLLASKKLLERWEKKCVNLMGKEPRHTSFMIDVILRVLSIQMRDGDARVPSRNPSRWQYLL